MKEMWNERYGKPEYYYGLEPNDFLAENRGIISPGCKVLSLGEGEGRNAVFLASLGAEVTAVDFSSVAAEKQQALAEKKKVKVYSVTADLADYDLGHSSWDGIVSLWCHLPSALRSPLLERIPKALNPGAFLLLEAYSPEQIRYGTGGPKDPDLLASLEDIKRHLPGMNFLVAVSKERNVREGIGHLGLSSVVQVLARRP